MPTVASPTANPYGPLTTFKTENVLPPAAVYLGPQDSILVSCFSPSLSAAVTVCYRLLTPQGKIITSQQVFTNPASPFGGGITIPPSEGYLLSLTVQCGAAARGQMFVRVFLMGSQVLTAASPIDQLLAQGYTTGRDTVAYPQVAPENSLSGRGWLHSVTIAAPAPGAFWSQTVPAGVRWILKSVQTGITTSAVVGNRVPLVSIEDTGSNVLANMLGPGVITASQAFNLSWFDGGAFQTIGVFMEAPTVRDCILSPGYLIAGNFGSLGAADQFTATQLFVEEWVSQN